jgi:nucleoside-triphosphatase THEP1
MIDKTNVFPFGIYCGELIDKENNCISMLLPEESGGFCVLFDSDKESEANSFIENVALKLLEVISIGNLEINIFDYSIRKRFSYLSDFRSEGLYKIVNKSQLANQKFTELEEIAFKRHDELLSNKIKTISIYNHDSKFTEIYYLLIINLEDFPDDLTSDKRFIELINAAHEAGIYVIAFGNKQEIYSNKKNVIKSILKQYPIIEILDNNVIIRPHEKANQLLELINRYECKIKLIQENRDKISENILEKLKQSNQDNLDQDFLSVPIGTTPDGRVNIYFSLGKYSESYNAFITGMAGTGKTTLLNNIILEIGKKYTSKDIELYLMDYKEGVEFQVFKNHPNCKKIFLDNEDLQAATDLLEEFQRTMKIRGKIFKEKGVPDIDHYNSLENIDKMPRLILMIDEVHRLFTGSWGEKEKFAKLLEDVARRGRAFGVHLILSTQSLLGTDINMQTMSQIPLRISYKLNSETDAEKIFRYGNTAPLKLKKYELIYNNESGNKEANTICRVNAPNDIKSTIDNIRATRDKSLCLTPEIVRTKDESIEDEDDKDVFLQTADWIFEPTSSSDIKYDTNEEKELLKNLQEQEGIVPENIEENK